MIEAKRQKGETLEARGHLLKLLEKAGTVRPNRMGGKYIVLEVIAVGGMGKIIAAYHEQLEALKVIKESVDPERLKAEAQLTRLAQKELEGRPRTARVCSIDDFDSQELYAVMNFVPGVELREILHIARQNPLPGAPCLTLRQAGEVMLQVLNAFEVLHHGFEVEVVHRDLKAENLMITKWGEETEVTVLDFGIAKRRDRSLTIDPRMTMGTPHYMAPEQFWGSNVTSKADVYAMGVLFFEMLSQLTPDRPSGVPFEPPEEDVSGWGANTLPQLLKAGIPDLGVVYPSEAVEPIQKFLQATLVFDPNSRGDVRVLRGYVLDLLKAAG
jgi:serine/threonine protein kinase